MKKQLKIIIGCFGKATNKFLILWLFSLTCCKKDSPSVFNSILGDYNVFLFSCPFNASMLDVGNTFSIIQSSSNLPNTVEIHFKSTRYPIWYGRVQNDSLLFSNQIVATTNPDYPPGANEIKGFGVFRNGTIDFQIDEFYTSNGYKQTCIFSAKKK